MAIFLKTKLGEVAEIVSGGTPSSAKLNYWENGNIFWATLPDLKNKYLYKTERMITEAGLKKSSAKLLPLNTVIFSSRATIGEVAITKVITSTNQGSKNFICNLEKVDPEFLYYSLKYNSKSIEQLASGATYKEINKTDLLNVEIELPLLSIQHGITSVLSGYDDLIENNEKRIKILEEMAQLLYTEWFVKFKFPGHEKVKLVDSGTEFGMIPEGWEVTNLGGIADIKWGDTSTTKKSYIEKGYNAYSASGLDGKLDHFDYDQDGIVLSAIGANCGITWLAKGKWSCIKNTIRILKKDPGVDIEYLFLLTSQYGYWKRRGAAQPFISQTEANSYNAIKPDSKILKIFTDLIKPLYDETHLLNNANISLSKIRDLLIPQLVTGKRELK